MDGALGRRGCVVGLTLALKRKERGWRTVTTAGAGSTWGRMVGWVAPGSNIRGGCVKVIQPTWARLDVVSAELCESRHMYLIVEIVPVSASLCGSVPLLPGVEEDHRSRQSRGRQRDNASNEASSC